MVTLDTFRTYCFGGQQQGAGKILFLFAWASTFAASRSKGNCWLHLDACAFHCDFHTHARTHMHIALQFSSVTFFLYIFFHFFFGNVGKTRFSSQRPWNQYGFDANSLQVSKLPQLCIREKEREMGERKRELKQSRRPASVGLTLPGPDLVGVCRAKTNFLVIFSICVASLRFRNL